MIKVSKPAAKNAFFEGKAVVLVLEKLGIFAEIRLSKMAYTKSKTEYFDLVCEETIKEIDSLSVSKLSDLTYYLERKYA